MPRGAILLCRAIYLTKPSFTKLRGLIFGAFLFSYKTLPHREASRIQVHSSNLGYILDH